MEPHLIAWERAQAVRAGRDRIRMAVKAAPTRSESAAMLADALLSDDDDVLASAAITVLLAWVRRVGPSEATRLLNTLDGAPSLYRRWDECSPRQRQSVIDMLRAL